MFRRLVHNVTIERPTASRKLLRRGVSLAQTAFVLFVIVVAAFFAIRNLSTNTATDLEETAGGIADPAQLVDRFQ
jgi:hypothetical protein